MDEYPQDLNGQTLQKRIPAKYRQKIYSKFNDDKFNPIIEIEIDEDYCEEIHELFIQELKQRGLQPVIKNGRKFIPKLGASVDQRYLVIKPIEKKDT